MGCECSDLAWMFVININKHSLRRSYSADALHHVGKVAAVPAGHDEEPIIVGLSRKRTSI